MFADHKIATAIGSVGVLVVLGHVVLGREIVPPVLALLGAALAAVVGLYVAFGHRRERDRSEGSPRGT